MWNRDLEQTVTVLLFLSGLFLLISVLVSIGRTGIVTQTNLISGILGIITMYLGNQGFKRKW